MNKSELIDKMSEQSDLSKDKIKDVIDSFLNVVTGALRDGDSVQIIGLGTFKSVARSQRAGRNPQTGEVIHIPAKLAPVFSASKPLKDAVNK